MTATQSVATVTRDGIAVHCAYDELVALEDLTENPDNMNVHPRAQLDLLLKIILKTGWRCPITVSRRSGLMIRGHGRLYAARLGNMTVAPVDYQDYASREEEIADLVADKQIPELAEWNSDKLGENLRFLEAQGQDLEVAGFDAASVEQLLGAGVGMSPADFVVPQGVDGGLTPDELLGSTDPTRSRVVLLVAPDIVDDVVRSVEYIAREYGPDRFKIVR